MSKAKDYEVKIAEKVEALLQKMTLREKVGQVTQIALKGVPPQRRNRGGYV